MKVEGTRDGSARLLLVVGTSPEPVLLLRRLRHEAGHETVGDGGAYPDFGKQIVGVFVDGLQIDVVVVEHGYEHVDDTDDPEVALGVALPVLAGIEERERAEQ